MAIPDDGRFTLVGNADGRDIARSCAGTLDRIAHHLLSPLPDFHRVVFNPSRLRKVLAMLALAAGNRAGPIKQNATRAGGSLIDGGDKPWHGNRHLILARRGWAVWH